MSDSPQAVELKLYRSHFNGSDQGSLATSVQPVVRDNKYVVTKMPSRQAQAKARGEFYKMSPICSHWR